MKKIILTLVICSIVFSCLFGQRYFSKAGEISFYSSTPMEDIKASSRLASTVIDLSSGAVQWAVLIKSFEFEKALMQEHFNENYMESSVYPKAMFKGSINEIEKIDLSNDQKNTFTAEGELEIHGVKQKVSCMVTLEINNGQILAYSELLVKPKDYEIKIPSLVRNNIAQEIKILIQANYESFEN